MGLLDDLAWLENSAVYIGLKKIKKLNERDESLVVFTSEGNDIAENTFANLKNLWHEKNSRPAEIRYSKKKWRKN